MGKGKKKELTEARKREMFYHTIHHWIKTQAGSAKKKKCQVNPQHGIRMEWANIDGIYERDLRHFVPLCKRCHRFMDSQKKSLPFMLALEKEREKILLTLRNVRDIGDLPDPVVLPIRPAAEKGGGSVLRRLRQAARRIRAQGAIDRKQIALWERVSNPAIENLLVNCVTLQEKQLTYLDYLEARN